MSSQNRYDIESVHMDVSSFEISYFDRKTRHQHVVKGITSLIPSEAFEEIAPMWDILIDGLRDRPLPVHPLEEPYPEDLVVMSEE